jgi:FKBP-type peptidyl-prolyl cis-trans isomerase SlyD
MQIGPGRLVELEYELKIKGGEVIETSARSGPLRYTHGDGKMLPGLEKRLFGLAPGEERNGVIPAREAFGTEESLPTKLMPKEAFPTGAALAVGSVFAAKDPSSGAPVQLKVLSTERDGIKVRLLHPLVGRDIEYRVKVMSVRDPSVKAGPPPTPGVVELDLDEIQET